jgi:hypothetical protein
MFGSFFDFDGKQNEFNAAFAEIDRLNVAEAKKKASERIVWHACWSSYSFEEWLWLHFCYCESALSEEELEDKLSEALTTKGKTYSYSKSDSEIFKKVYSDARVVSAVDRSRKLYEKAMKSGDPHRNPSNGVFEFVSFFLKNILK